MSGHVGQVRHGYHVVARLRAWKVEGVSLEAVVTDVNDVWLGASPMHLWLLVGKRALVWTDPQLSFEDGTCRAILRGTPETKDAPASLLVLTTVGA